MQPQVNEFALGPGDPPYSGHHEDLDGSVSCSVVIDPELVTALAL